MKGGTQHVYVQEEEWELSIVSLMKKRQMHNPGRNVALALVVASLPSTLVGRRSALVSEPHCEKERESEFERLAGQMETRIPCQTGREHCLIWKAEYYSRGQKPTRVRISVGDWRRS